MARWLTLVPAYGRDYTSKKAVKADFDADKDFRISDISCQWDGKVANKSDIARDYDKVEIRYAKLRKLVVLGVR